MEARKLSSAKSLGHYLAEILSKQLRKGKMDSQYHLRVPIQLNILSLYRLVGSTH